MRLRLAAAALALLPSPVFAQEAGVPVDPGIATTTDVAPPAGDTGGDFAIVGLGLGVLPDYEGSDDYSLSPVPGAIGRLGGYNFVLAGNRVSVDLIRDGVGPTWDFQAGPVAVVNFNRSSRDGIEDAQVAALGEVNTAIEVGGYVGVGKTGVLTSDFDRLSASASYRVDIANGHESGIFTPTISYVTPLSTKALAGVILSGEHVQDGYADAYFTVTPAQAAATGLPAYRARGGWKNWSLGVVGMRSLTGDLQGGWQLFGGAVYRRLLNDFADSPITRRNGSASQWLGVVGVAYSF